MCDGVAGGGGHDDHNDELHLSFLSSSLFPDVVNCMQTDNLELKKLVYLYLMNYAKSQPDMAIMAVNSFVKVSASVSIKEETLYLFCLLQMFPKYSKNYIFAFISQKWKVITSDLGL